MFRLDTMTFSGNDANGNVTAFSGTNVITGQSSSATGTEVTNSTVNNVSFTSVILLN